MTDLAKDLRALANKAASHGISRTDQARSARKDYICAVSPNVLLALLDVADDHQALVDQLRERIAALTAARDELAVMLEAIDTQFGVHTHRVAELRKAGQ